MVDPAALSRIFAARCRKNLGLHVCWREQIWFSHLLLLCHDIVSIQHSSSNTETYNIVFQNNWDQGQLISTILRSILQNNAQRWSLYLRNIWVTICMNWQTQVCTQVDINASSVIIQTLLTLHFLRDVS